MLVQKDWRPAGGPNQFMVIPWPFEKEEHDFLMVLPFQRYTTISEHLKAHSIFNEDMTAFKRVIGSCSKRVEFDKFGRIALSQSLLEEAGIKEEAELVGAVDHFEIWNPDRFKASLVEHKKAAALVKPSIPV